MSSTINPKTKIEISKVGFCFELYQKEYQFVTISNLKKEDLVELENLLLKVIKCDNIDNLKKLNFYRGKSCNGIPSGHKLKNHPKEDSIIHIGDNGKKFRIHGWLYGRTFKVISIDPNHKAH